MSASFQDYEVVLDSILTKEQAQHEIERHGCDFPCFLCQAGDKTEYKGMKFCIGSVIEVLIC